MKLRSILVAISVLVLTAVAFGQPDLRAQLEAQLKAWHESGKFAGATLGVCRGANDCFALAVGYSDRASKRPMRPDDVMLAGSVGKTFAAAVVLRLVREGRIDLDARIEKYLGSETWFDRLPNARSITVRQLMNHTSGLVRYEFNPKFLTDLKASPEKSWRPEELIAYLFDSKAPFEPGKGWDYSDTNYIVLGMIVEKVTGKKYLELVRKWFIEPLKLKRTHPQRRKDKRLVQGYAGAGNDFTGTDEVIRDGRFVINPEFEWTGGGMASNSLDLARWATYLYDGTVVGPGLRPAVLDGVPAPMLGRETKYGLGVIIRTTPAGVSYGHSGFFPGYMTDVMYFPEHKIAVAVQVNSSVPRDLGKPLGRVLTEAASLVIANSR